MNIKMLVVAMVATLACAFGASAADLGANGGSYKEGGYVADGRPLWTGIYGAAFIGGEIDTVTLGDTDIGLGPKGVFGGVRLGYDYSTPAGWLIGGFGEGSISDISADAGGKSLRQDLRWGIGGRVGKEFGSTLYYVPVSYVLSHAKGDGFDWGHDLHGVRVGGGVEQQLGGGWAVFGEAGSTWYGDIGTGVRDLSASTQAVDGRIGVSKRF